MPKTVASRGSEQVAPMAVANPYERPKEVGTRWSQEEDRALRAAIEQHTKSKGPSWPLIAQTLGQLGLRSDLCDVPQPSQPNERRHLELDARLQPVRLLAH